MTVPDFPRRPISIIGPTASGKSALAVSLAEALFPEDKCEIISQDAYQVYRGMDIGTAKPAKEQLLAVPHHMINIKDPAEEMSVAEFQVRIRSEMRSCSERGIRPILVGGSGLYARSAVDDLSFPPFNPSLRQLLESKLAKEGSAALWKKLEDLDPASARKIDERNGRKIVRALEVATSCGSFKPAMPKYRYLFPCLQIGLDMPRGEIDLRIGERVKKMREAGLREEVASLKGTLSRTASQAIGYKQILSFLNGEIEEGDAFSQILSKTKRLARKQMGWFGRDPRVHWLNASSQTLLQDALELVESADRGEFDFEDLGEKAPARRRLGAVA